MRVGTARAAAAEWVLQNASTEEWFMGAYFSGSTIGLPDDLEMSEASDIDVVVVTEQAEPPLKLGKFVYRDTLIEITYLSWNQLASIEEVLTSYHLAGSFRVDTIIADPTGQLRRMQTEVSRHFAERVWVRRRCENARQKIENGLRSIDISAPRHDQIMAWLFSTGVTTHVLLVAALRNPTVRLRYLAARNVLKEYGRIDFYPDLLRLLDCNHLTPRDVEYHLDQLARTFDVATAKARTPFFFSTDITTTARPIAIDGSRELIRTGYHREALFWIVATFARCHKILAADAPDQQLELAPAFDAIVADLGITSSDSLIRRAEDVIHFLPNVWETAEAILLANPGIV
ncbi:hypothetical protein O9H85_30290 [Paenibacillus filicis]|uniref:Polymerase nucleotidyl transferase domain-containing protein n=1 Tax=Paenibacillus gyeongsangnamensis TaxID=3388067 RepID=A0ABT4QI84_9BACL|nr:hypothetical protein [Paenibacillus filicis]MCZ8516601.1 hypothetical protein [Paenibacillus filicis]